MVRISVGLIVVVLSAGTVDAAPGEVTHVQATTDGFAWGFEPAASEYRVYRGLVSDLGADFGSCYIPALTRTDFVEPAAPSAGEAWFYLVTALDDTGEGTAGSGNGGSPRTTGSCATGDPLGLSVEVPVPRGYEQGGTAARFRISRGPALPLPEVTAQFTLAGDDDPRRGSAISADFTLADGNGTSIDHSIVIPEGATSVDIVATPVVDTLTEVPETLRLILLGNPDYTFGQETSGAVRISDATAVAENERLLLA